MTPPRLSFTFSLYLCFVFSTLHSSIFVVSQRGGVIIHPEFIPENDSQIPIARPPSGNAAALEGANAGGKIQPFLTAGPDAYDVATLQPLLVSLATAIHDLSVQVSQEGSSVDIATLTLSPSAAQIGCSIYSAYQSYCKVGTASSFCILGLCETPSSEDLFASCACYSSTLWVPNLYDNAVWACNQISSGKPGFTASVTTVDGKPTGFCNYNNPRLASFAYGLSTAATAATTVAISTPTPAPAPATTPAAPASPTSVSSASTVMMTGLGGMGRVGWALIGIIVVGIVLV